MATVDRRGHQNQRDRLGQIQLRYEKFTRWILIVLAIQVVLLIALAGWLLSISSRTSANANQGKSLALSFQRERLGTVRRNCEAQNARHDNTIKELNYLVHTIPPQNGQTKAQQIQGAEQFVFIIDALQPKTDCDTAVRAAQSN